MLGLLLSLSCLSARAEEQGSVLISFVGLGELPDSLLYRDGGKTHMLDIPTSGRGAPVSYSGPSPMVLFKEIVDAEGKKTDVTVATIPFSSAWPQVLAVLVSGGSMESPIHALAFDDSLDGFPPDHARLFNFYSGDIAVSNNGEVSKVASGKSTMLLLTNHGGRAWMKLATQRGADWSSLPTFVAQITPGIRLLIFAYEQRTEFGTQPVYRTITQTVAVKPAEVAMR